MCSSWTHAWTLNSCTIVSAEPCYKSRRRRRRRRRERRVSSHCSSGPGHGTEIRDKRHEKRRTYAAPVSSLRASFPFPRFAHDPPRRRPSYLPVRSPGHVRTRVYVRVREIEPVDRTASSSADRARIEGREKKRAGRTRGQHTSVVSRVVYHGSRFHGQDHWNNGWIHASPSSFSSSSSYSCSTAPPIRSYRN